MTEWHTAAGYMSSAPEGPRRVQALRAARHIAVWWKHFDTGISRAIPLHLQAVRQSQGVVVTVGCCVAVTFLQGLGSVRSIMKQHFPLVSGSAPMQLKGAVLGEREQCWARGLQPDQGRCACTSTSHKSSSCCMATEQPSCRPCFWGRCTSIVCRVALTCCDWCSPTNTHW